MNREDIIRKQGVIMQLRGDRNQCQACKHYFNSTFAFDKHRTGDFGLSRRCKTGDEMRQVGMSINSAGFWISSAYTGPAKRDKHGSAND